jgi:hypothetical protein
VSYPDDDGDLNRELAVDRLLREVGTLSGERTKVLEQMAIVWLQDALALVKALDGLTPRDRRAVMFLLGETVELTVSRFHMVANALRPSPGK